MCPLATLPYPPVRHARLSRALPRPHLGGPRVIRVRVITVRQTARAVTAGIDAAIYVAASPGPETLGVPPPLLPPPTPRSHRTRMKRRGGGRRSRHGGKREKEREREREREGEREGGRGREREGERKDEQERGPE